MATLRQGSGQAKKAQGTGDGGQAGERARTVSKAGRILACREYVHATVAAMLDGRLSREGPPFRPVDLALDALVEACLDVKRDG